MAEKSLPFNVELEEEWDAYVIRIPKGVEPRLSKSGKFYSLAGGDGWHDLGIGVVAGVPLNLTLNLGYSRKKWEDQKKEQD